MRVKLYSPAMANSSISRYASYNFDAKGYTTCGHLEDIKMLVERGATPIEIVEDDEMGTNDLYLIDVKRLVSENDDRGMEREIKHMIERHYQLLLVKDAKVLLYR